LNEKRLYLIITIAYLQGNTTFLKLFIPKKARAYDDNMIWVLITENLLFENFVDLIKGELKQTAKYLNPH